MAAKRIDNDNLFLFSISDVAKRLGCSTKTVERKIREGKIKPTRVDGKRKVTRANFIAYLENNSDDVVDFE